MLASLVGAESLDSNDIPSPELDDDFSEVHDFVTDTSSCLSGASWESVGVPDGGDEASNEGDDKASGEGAAELTDSDDFSSPELDDNFSEADVKASDITI